MTYERAKELFLNRTGEDLAKHVDAKEFELLIVLLALSGEAQAQMETLIQIVAEKMHNDAHREGEEG